ncbi:hypothetical protein M569_04586 [Genlisea aurea]|uniref:Uncharacterized protein n=1 Tax=Genlisea aurea TaxID=192259 RepID=S8CTJ9_9LAMI|nr:hypothetical protein M569_04586 [Genlisea aurea]
MTAVCLVIRKPPAPGFVNCSVVGFHSLRKVALKMRMALFDLDAGRRFLLLNLNPSSTKPRSLFPTISSSSPIPTSQPLPAAHHHHVRFTESRADNANKRCGRMCSSSTGNKPSGMARSAFEQRSHWSRRRPCLRQYPLKNQ